MTKKIRRPFPLLAFADQRVEDLRRLVPRILKQWKASDIHDARVATRRLKVIIDVLEPVLRGKDTKAFRHVLKDLRQSLGPLRDADVMLEHLGEMKWARLVTGNKWLIEQLHHQRKSLRVEAAKGIHPSKVLARLGSWWGVREELVDCREAVDCLLAESIHLQLDEFVERAEALINNRPAKADDQDAQNPHQLRIIAKKLRYTLEMATNEKNRDEKIVSSFKEMQDALGLWHDYVVLADSAMKISRKQTLFMHDAELQLQVLDLAGRSMRRAIRNLDEFKSVWNKRGEKLTATIRAHFPLTRLVEIQTIG